MRRAVTAVALVLTMLMAGCLGIGEDLAEAGPVSEPETTTVETGSWALMLTDSVRNPVAGDLLIFTVNGVADEHLDLLSIGQVTAAYNGGVPETVLDVAASTNGEVVVAFIAEQTGVVTITVELFPSDGVTFNDGTVSLSTDVTVGQAGLRLVVPTAVNADEGLVAFTGRVAPLRERPPSDLDGLTCTATLDLGSNEGPMALALDDNLGFEVMLTEDGLPPLVTITTSCIGPVDTASDTRSVRLILSEKVLDADGDGVQDELDRCPNGIGEAQGWQSRSSTDHDGDGCRDRDEDEDDDDDGRLDVDDLCLSETGWTSTENEDHDTDGCRDDSEDQDDDNDGRPDVEDACPRGTMGWTSLRAVDWDLDGCLDSGEDLDDDDDAVLDNDDACPKGESAWIQDNTTDWDFDGCLDRTEDEDDDNDGINDADLNGTMLDMCPQTSLGAVVDEFGCAADQRDSDEDGVNDASDLCSSTPLGESVDAEGCHDMDDDGVHMQNDVCPNSPARWS
ncbi:MAG TPA: hypothetical protein D7I05_03985, partial [Candidatus Poseidoniales archaeon]